jgi:glycosyltransferase involved in cell wall biosynthesis
MMNRTSQRAPALTVSTPSKRVCLVYDCLFPHTVGGAERWYRNLAERLALGGHQVTYVTLRQWQRGARPDVRGVDVRAVGPRMGLYAKSGRRRILPPLVFGAGVLWHLARHGREYDVVHTASFPYFSLLAAAVARIAWRYRLIVDWHEVWTGSYWREYLGRAAGTAGWLVQRMCARVPQRAFCFSRLHADRLRDAGLRERDITTLAGEYDGPLDAGPVREAQPFVVFAGRHIPEKRVLAIPPAIARARERLPELQAVILGDGPERPEVVRLVTDLGLEGVVEVPGFVATEAVADLMGCALCMVLPSRREGYGMVVIEAAARGTPSVVVEGPDNASVELVAEGENGFVAASSSPEDLAAAIVRVHAEGAALRGSTAAWFGRNAPRLSLAHSLELVLGAYRHSPRIARSYEASVPAAVAAQVKRAARSSPAARRRSASTRSVNNRSIAAAIADSDSGSKRNAASPATSSSAPRPEQATGIPRAIASSTGSPKPSCSEGQTTQEDAA